MSKKSAFSRVWPVLPLLFSVLFCASGIMAESYNGVNILEPGRYSVGFRTFEFFDENRTVLSKYDYFGNALEGKRARPIQICVWYPARDAGSDTKMIIGEYNFPYPENSEFIDYLSVVQDREIGRLQVILRGDQDLMLDLLNYETGAVRDAPFAEGDFHLIMYGPDFRKGILENCGLFEYLAGNGFVVAVVHSLGSFDLNPAENPADLETLIRDMEFALSHMKNQPFVKQGKIGILGYGAGGPAALLMQMRNYDVDAVACIQGDFGESDFQNMITQNPYYNVGRMSVPLLHIYQRGDSPADDTVLKSLRFSSRYAVEFPDDYDILITEYDLISSLKRDSTGEFTKSNIEGHKKFSRYTLDFFKAYLTDDKASLKRLVSKPVNASTVTFLPGEEIPPTENQFMTIIGTVGVDEAAELYRKFKPSNPDHTFFQEAIINNLGYQYLQSGHIPEALTLLAMNADAFPNSANVWDSYGEAAMTNGDYELALKNYKRALEILPNDTLTNEQLKNLIQTGAAARVDSLEQLLSQIPGDN